MSTALAGPPLARAVAERTLSPSDDPALDAAARRLAAVAGDSLRGLLFFGSRRTRAARADAWSAYDLFVVVSRYGRFYDALRAAGLSRKRSGLLAAVSRVLPPTQLSLRFAAEGVHVKAAVIDERALVRETSPARHDHFCIGRLFQPARLLYAGDEGAREAALACLVSAVRETWGWARPWLPARFDAAAYGRSALGTSMRFEVRPEPAGRADELWEAQRELQAPVLEALLRELGAAGELRPLEGAPGSWSIARAVGSGERLRRELYFRRSLARATARWLKHVVSFEGWLEYIVHKASRHGGEELRLDERERRYPLLLLWGRAFRYLRSARRGERKRR
jgi:hypothetical protein